VSLEISPDTLRDLGLEPEAAREMADKLGAISLDGPAGDLWSRVSRDILSPDVPFAVHRHLHSLIFRDWDASQAPPPAWTPTDDEVSASNIAAFCKKAGLPSVHQLHRWSRPTASSTSCRIGSPGAWCRRAYPEMPASPSSCP